VLSDLSKGGEEFNCICAKFNKDGILCSHILKIMIEKEVSRIPDKYIIDRWMKMGCEIGQAKNRREHSGNKFIAQVQCTIKEIYNFEFKSS